MINPAESLGYGRFGTDKSIQRNSNDIFTICCLVICVEQPRDLFLVVDDSASIGHRDIHKVRSFLSVLVSSVHVSRHMTRIGLLQFSDKENTGIRFNLDNKFDADAIRQKVDNLKYNGGPKTLTDLALRMVAEQVRSLN